MPRLTYSSARPADTASSANAIADFMFALMLRNIATPGWVIAGTSGRMSRPGCIIASPSFPTNCPGTDQDYVFHWTRDAAIVAMELAARRLPSSQLLDDYVVFSRLTQKLSLQAGQGVGFACYRVDGTPRDGADPRNPQESASSVQSDGPALRVLALLSAWSQLLPERQATAREIIADDCAWLLGAYAAPTANLWEETVGQSLFARAVQRKCFLSLAALSAPLSLGLDLDPIRAAAGDLGGLLQAHWKADHDVSILDAGGDQKGQDLNADAVMAAIHGSLDCTDPQLLATAARLRAFFEGEFSVNRADAAAGEDAAVGPLIGRYPLDTYDGDDSAPGLHHGHPWAPCTCAFAELYYRVALAVKSSHRVALDPLSGTFFDQVEVDARSPWQAAVVKLEAAGDRMLDAVVFHSDHLELSEQFDRDNGFEKSVRDLTWSYASFLSAVRVRQAL